MTKLSGMFTVRFLNDDGTENRFHFNTIERAEVWARSRIAEGVKVLGVEAQTAEHFNSLIASMGLAAATAAALRR